MKNTFLLTFALILLAGSPLKAQEKEEAATLNKVVNTLKERITLADTRSWDIPMTMQQKK